MARTYFHDFTRDDGTPVTVEYSTSAGEPYYDNPGHICDGGGCGPGAMIVDAWPNTPAFDALVGRHSRLTWDMPRDSGLARRAWARIAAPVLAVRIWIARRKAVLTDAERQRMEAWLAEHCDFGPDYEDWDDPR